jgi:small subunit ribosomal protein S2
LLCSKIADAAVEGRRELEARQKDNEPKEEGEPAAVISTQAGEASVSVDATPEVSLQEMQTERSSTPEETPATAEASETPEAKEAPVTQAEPELVAKEAL